MRLGLKNKGTEREPRAPVPWASPLLGLKPPRNENQRKATVEDRGQHLRQCVSGVLHFLEPNTACTTSSGPPLTWKAFSPLLGTPASCKDTGSLTWALGPVR